MIEYVVIEDFLPVPLKDKIEILFSKDLPWYYSERTVGFADLMNGDYGNDLIKETYQFNHPVLVNDRYMSSPEINDRCLEVLRYLEIYLERKITKIGRIKANLTLPNNWDKENYHPPHFDDVEKDAFTLVYYINDSDGDFRIFDKVAVERFTSKEQVLDSYKDINCLARISPKKGKAALVPSNVMHSGSCPITANKRMMINFVFGLN